MKVPVAVLLLAIPVLGGIDFPVDFSKGLITNGQSAEPKQFPYQVFLKLRRMLFSVLCGGVLISKEWVLTAAHCTKDVIEVDVYLGTTNLSAKNEVGRQIIKASKENVIAHEKWETPDHDISLIKLPTPVEFNDYIQIAVLPKLGSSTSYAGEDAIASGWGDTRDNQKNLTLVLQWVKVPIMDNMACKKIWVFYIKDTHVCIDTKCENKICNVCRGDSGGPLVLADGSRTLIGLASFVHKFGCESKYPGVFTRITSYLNWIKDKTGIANV